MSSTINLAPEIDILSGTASTTPHAPTIVSVVQVAGMAIVGIQQSRTTGSYPILSYQLFRGITNIGPWFQIDAEPINGALLTTNAFDKSPVIGTQIWYAAKALDQAGQSSGLSVPFTYTAYGQTTLARANLSSSAFGPYPLLGQDVFVNPATGEGVVGPNGDLLGVNGLDCFAQDLAIRMRCTLGDFILHPDCGLAKGGGIGAGQATPPVEAQALRTQVVEAIQQDPRTFQVQSVSVANSGYGGDGWVIQYSLMCIGVEDPLHANAVAPYDTQ